MSIKVAIVTEFCESCGLAFRKCASDATRLCLSHRMDGEVGIPSACDLDPHDFAPYCEHDAWPATKAPLASCVECDACECGRVHDDTDCVMYAGIYQPTYGTF